jgi:hypothetical protein
MAMKSLSAILIVLLGAGSLILYPSRATEERSVPQAEHLWNRLHRLLYTRAAKDGKSYVYEGLEAPMGAESQFLIDGAAHEQAIALLDEFLRTNADKEVKDPLKRALLLRDLWYVFDRTAHPFEAKESEGTKAGERLLRRRALQKRLARVMRRLELTSKQIQALPDNYAAAVRSGVFAQEPSGADRAHPYLAPDLLRKDSSWILVTSAEHPRGFALAAPAHVEFAGGRSVFLVFLKLPGGRRATLGYLDKLAESKKQVQFPDGTQVALLRRMVLMNDQGRLQLTPLTESLQLRMFPTVQAPVASEFVLDRNALSAGEAGGLRTLKLTDEDYFHFGTPSAVLDPFENREVRPPASRPMTTCSSCHTGAADQRETDGVFTIRTFANVDKESWRGAAQADLDSQVNETLDKKRLSYAWGLYEGLRETETPRTEGDAGRTHSRDN